MAIIVQSCLRVVTYQRAGDAASRLVDIPPAPTPTLALHFPGGCAGRID